MAPVRDIKLRISLVTGREHEVTLREDAPELVALFAALATRPAEDQFVQLPVDGGRIACSFRTAQLVSIVSEPPVVVDLQTAPAPDTTARQPGRPRADDGAALPRLRRPRFAIVDDALSQAEHDEILAYALVSEKHFQSGTVTTYDPEVRRNLVILNFGDSVHSRLFENRLLIRFPLLAKLLGVPQFPLAQVESQLTAAEDGYYFKVHSDEAPEVPRTLTCVYYLHRQPRGFAGGELRLYDSIEHEANRRPAETFTAIAPLANRLVVFGSAEFHEARPVRCPSREFADSRFAITTWLHRAKGNDAADAAATFGWGHFRCGVVATQRAGGGS